MKQVSQNYKTGEIRLEEVDAPALKSGGVLVQTQYSVISTGTEGMKAREGKLSYLGKARARPDQVKKVIQTVQQQGLKATYEKVMNKLDSLTPLGYSLSGVVAAVQPGAEEFQVGQRVACAGAGYANHAELNFVPKNLVVPVPENVAMEHAAFATIGAIAMQGFRQAEMQLGENACVIGLGLLGQLLVQILRASGVSVVGIDLVQSRCELAQDVGAKLALTPDDPGLASSIKQLTGGIGIDCTFITAGGNSNVPVELAVEIARDRGRVVDIGKTKLDLPWNTYYEKELDVRFSRSYGPGRYDPNYEERGIDYPIGYVRWTERRNMESFLALIADSKLDVGPIISAVHPFSEAEQVYETLASGSGSGLGVVFEHAMDVAPRVSLPQFSGSPSTAAPQAGSAIGVIGAGNYACSMLLPHLRVNKDAQLREVATATSLSGKNAAVKFGFDRCSTDYKSLLAANDIDTVLIATRHGSHAHMTAEALACGKTVYVEKPLAIDLDGLEQVRATVKETGNDRLMVGFNRRFSPLVQALAKVFENRVTPLVMSYRVHVGQLDSNSWYLDTAAHGSRFTGEAGHFFDVMAHISGSRPVSVYASCLRPQPTTADDLDNVSVIVNYEDGSVGNMSYLTQGSVKLPKEFIEVFGGGKTAQLHNFERLDVFEGTKQSRVKASLDKGQKEEMRQFVESIKSGGSMPISLDDVFDTTLLTLLATESLRSARAMNLADYWAEQHAG